MLRFDYQHKYKRNHCLTSILLAFVAITFPFASGCSHPGHQANTGTSAVSVITVDSSAESASPDTASAVSCGTDEQASAATPSDNSITPAVWKVQADNGNIVYMMGTIHVGDDAVNHMPDYFERAYVASDAIAVEADIDAASTDTAQLTELAGKLYYTDGTTIKEHLSTETYNGIVALLKQKNVYQEYLDRCKPAVWISLLSMLSAAEAGLDNTKGVDVTLLKRAKNDNKQVLEMESIAMQYDILFGFSDRLCDLLLHEYTSPDALQKSVEGVRELYEHWKNGTIDDSMLLDDTFTDINEADTAYYEEYKQKMLTNRNIGMKDAVEQYLADGSKVFVMAGALHFVGDDGIVRLLQKDGYQVTRYNG